MTIAHALRPFCVPWILASSLILPAIDAAQGFDFDDASQHPLVRVGIDADLDGDGRDEHLSATFYHAGGYGHDRVVLEVRGRPFAFRGMDIHPKIHIVDVDSTDAYKEIAIAESGPSDDHATHLFRIAAGTIVPLGTVPGWTVGPPQVNGSGVISTHCRGKVLATWWYPCEYCYEDGRSELIEVVQHWKPMKIEVIVNQDLPLVVAPHDLRHAGTIRAGEKAVLLATDNRAWCKIIAESDVTGWFAFVGERLVEALGRPTSEVFEGLSQAD